MAENQWSLLGKRKKKDYLSSWGALYGDEKPTPTKPKPAPKKPTVAKPAVPTEDQEQFKLAHWLRLHKIRHHHSPNGGLRVNFEGEKFKRMGTSPGYPDIQIPIPSGCYAGLYIELKRTKGGVVSESQKEWISWLNMNGSKAVVCYGADEAIKVVSEYLGL